jgi:hypothetical protein
VHDQFLRDSAIGELDVYYMSDPAQAASTRSFLSARVPDPAAQVFRWGVIPAGVDTTKVLKLCVEHRDASIAELPKVIRTLPNLLWLSMPRRFVPSLTREALPPTVRTLSLQGGENVALPKSLVLPGLERLIAGRNAVLKFSRHQIPDVSELGVKFDPGGSVLREVVGMEKLVSLAVLPFSNRDILEAVTRLPLRFLKASRGNLDTVEPLRDCPTLTDLWLEDLTRLTSIASLVELPRLRELSVTYCSKLRLDRSILRLPALRRLMFFACKDIGLAPRLPEIEQLGLDHFLASGTR